MFSGSDGSGGRGSGIIIKPRIVLFRGSDGSRGNRDSDSRGSGSGIIISPSDVVFSGQGDSRRSGVSGGDSVLPSSLTSGGSAFGVDSFSSDSNFGLDGSNVNIARSSDDCVLCSNGGGGPGGPITSVGSNGCDDSRVDFVDSDGSVVQIRRDGGAC